MAEEDQQLESALDLFRRLPPKSVETNLALVLELVPDLTEDLLQLVDQPLKVAQCPETKKEYLLCDYNRDGDSYRSPWSNQYDPPLDDGALPPQELREMEIKANSLFDTYRELYYEGGISSVYFWELETGFAACVLIKKDASGQRGVDTGVWDSIHVIDVDDNGDSAVYKLTSTIMLSMAQSKPSLNLSGNITRQAEKQLEVTKYKTHLVNIGNMVQDMENSLRNMLDTVYFGKTKEITHSLRDVHSKQERERQRKLAQELQDSVSDRSKQ
eukprot:gb/GECH01011803.1/.p1 GENE.gb/GECH01011803.1/~~gb/GECH01011803.1/.p1  ORF type:complete len:271 (+),score=59.06 gb/GECH01011803.1/:1-813(+)